MSEHEQERFEAELRRVSPAPLPPALLARLQAAEPEAEPARPAQAPRPPWLVWRRWLAPIMAAAAAGLLPAGRAYFHSDDSAKKERLAVSHGLRADDVRVDQELLSSFDVVAELPGGEPVRFHCQKWSNQWIVTDKNHGVEIEQNSPRIEVTPVRFETY